MVEDSIAREWRASALRLRRSPDQGFFFTVAVGFAVGPRRVALTRAGGAVRRYRPVDFQRRVQRLL